MDVAVFVGPFPKLSKTFIINEVVGLMKRGHDVTLVASRDPGDLLVHDSIQEYDIRDRTFYLDREKPENNIVAGLNLGPLLARNI